MSQTTPSRKRFSLSTLFGWLIFIAALFFFCIIGLALLPNHFPFKSKAELNRIRADLAIAKAKWMANPVENYEIDVGAYTHPSCMKSHVTLFIRRGRLGNTKEDICGIKASDFLPPKVFDTVERVLAHANPDEYYLSISFDSEYGFMSKYIMTSNSSGNSFRIYYEFTNFTPLNLNP